MARQTSYTCDECEKPVSKTLGPLFVTVSSDTEPQVNAEKEFCSFDCAAAWMKRGGDQTATRAKSAQVGRA